MPAWRASCSKISNLISQASVSCVSCTGLSWTVLGYCLAASFRLVTSVLRVATVIRWLPTIAAAPILTGEHPVTTRPAPSTTADTLISLRSTGMSLLTLCQPTLGQLTLGQLTLGQLLPAGPRVPTG